jgi:hypothetical protein
VEPAPNQDRSAQAGEALARIRQLMGLMVAVATGGADVETLKSDYTVQRGELRAQLHALGIPDSNPFDDLWAWYGRWSSGDLPSYQSRRRFLGRVFAPVIEQLRMIEGTPAPGEVHLPGGAVRGDGGDARSRRPPGRPPSRRW